MINRKFFKGKIELTANINKEGYGVKTIQEVYEFKKYYRRNRRTKS